MSTDLPILYSLGATPFVDVASALQEDYRFVLTNSMIGNSLRDAGVQVAVLEDAFDLNALYEAQGIALWMQHRIGDSLLTGPLTNLNMDYPEMHTPQITQWFPNATYESMIYAIGRIIALERIVGEHGIDGVLTHEDVSMDGRVLAQLGAHNGVKVVHIPHANYFISPTEGDIHATTKADALGVYGEYMKDWFIRAGVDPAIITVIGAAHWDKMYEDSERISKEHARRCLGLDQEKPVYTYASSWAQDTNAWGRGEKDLIDSMRWVLDTAKQEGAELVIKLHPHQPKESVERYASVAQEAGIKLKLTSHYNAHTLKAADVVITQGSSNLAVEAGIMGVPVVEMFQPGTRYPEKYDIPGTWGDDLTEQVARAMDEGVNEDFVKDMSMGPGATERAKAYVKEQFA
jgi:hypothetical protein